MINMIKKFFQNIIFSTLIIGVMFSFACGLFCDNIYHKNNMECDLITSQPFKLEDNMNQNNELNNRTVVPTQTFFNGSYSTIYLNTQASGVYINYTQKLYYMYHSDFQCYISLNFSGQSSSLNIYYPNYFSSSDYLVHVDDVSSAVDAYYLDKDCDYLFEFTNTYFLTFGFFSFNLSLLDNSLLNHENYILHEMIDPTSNVGYHHIVEYHDYSNISYTPTNSNIQSYSSSCTYTNLLNFAHYFYSPSLGINDNRRIVDDTGYYEYNSIAKVVASDPLYNPSSGPFLGSTSFGSATFVSETDVVSCAHLFYTNYNNNQLTTDALQRNVSFYPGINLYEGIDSAYYGVYSATEVYLPISLILMSSYEIRYDWAYIKTECESSGIRTHSYMGMQIVTGYSSDNPFELAKVAGYPMLQQFPNPDYLEIYRYTMWTSYPLTGNVYNSNGIIQSNYHVTSKGNSGGPLYVSYTFLNKSNRVYVANLFGITVSSTQTAPYVSYQCSINKTIIELIREVSNESTF